MRNSMRHLLTLSVIFLILGLSVLSLISQERINLSTPEVKTTSQYEIGSLTINPNLPGTTIDESRIFIRLVGQNNEIVDCNYTPTTTPTSTTLINGLNTANLSLAYAGNATTGSLRQRIYHRLVTMGEATQICGHTLVGTVQ